MTQYFSTSWPAYNCLNVGSHLVFLDDLLDGKRRLLVVGGVLGLHLLLLHQFKLLNNHIIVISAKISGHCFDELFDYQNADQNGMVRILNFP